MNEIAWRREVLEILSKVAERLEPMRHLAPQEVPFSAHVEPFEIEPPAHSVSIDRADLRWLLNCARPFKPSPESDQRLYRLGALLGPESLSALGQEHPNPQSPPEVATSCEPVEKKALQGVLVLQCPKCTGGTFQRSRSRPSYRCLSCGFEVTGNDEPELFEQLCAKDPKAQYYRELPDSGEK